MKLLHVFIPRLLLCCNGLLIAALLTSAWLPYISPHYWWPSGFAGLLFPVLLCITLVFIPIWILYKKWYYWLSIAAIALCYKAILVSVSLHPAAEQMAAGQQQTPHFTVMTFNTSSMGVKGYRLDEELHAGILQTLKEASPDLLCLQEFYTNDDPSLTNNIAAIQEQLGYPYYYFTSDKTQWNTWHYGIILFSRYPVIHARKVPCGYSEAGSGSSILEADVRVYDDTLRICTAQLRSYMFNAADLAQLHAIKTLDGSHAELPAARSLLGKMRYTFTARAEQTRLLQRLATESPYPVIICGDLNDTPVSYTYYTLSRYLQDAFLQKGSGIGRTLSFLSPTLRIDYILAHSQFNVHAYRTFHHPLFEHFPVMASLSLKKQ